ncbi:GNAT family protein [Winogradskya consettensis]|uniref:Succinyl-CoA transferase Rv0802c n=2 Tax=Winogradskya consettensis TaxID=113560 RepID=A0A919T0H4_9ACTN|nr:succinyl-CoA transferase Rv0802c [Actinoplanes consettensis]
MIAMIAEHWPMFGLRLRTPRLELRQPDLADLAELASQAARGVHDPAIMPFAMPWTDAEPEERARATIKWHWQVLSRWTPEHWALPLVAVADGRVIGTQEIAGKNFAILREVETGSWLGLEHQGKGYGTEMRAAVLALAFAGLGAEYATTEAFATNHASYRVSQKLGYLENGIKRHVVRGEPVIGRRMVLDRAGWDSARTVDVEISGLEPCRAMFGLSS